MILITGGTGTSGKAIVQELSATGAEFRVMVRNPDKAQDIAALRGAHLVKGDFTDESSLRAVLYGVERALLLSNPAEDQVQVQSRFISVAKQAGVRHIVKFSSAGAAVDAPFAFGKWHGQTEEELKNSGIAWTMLRPTFFMQNFLGMAASIKSAGVFYQPAGDGKAPYVDVRDIAAVAVKALTQPRHEGRTYLITGPTDLSCYDIAASISRATGKAVKYVDVPRDTAEASMIQTGMPQWQAEAICQLMDQLRSGTMSGPTDVVEKIAGKTPISFDHFARENAAAFG